MMRKTTYLFLLVSLLLAACAPQGATADPQPALTLEDCTLTSGQSNQIDAQCGTLDVPEDPSNPQGRQIALKIAVIPAINRKPAPDPLFLLAGGPGQSALETFPAMLNIIYNIHQERDIVLVDQRGTGKSNPLRCLDPEDEALNDLTNEQLQALLISCPEQLDADLRFYTTEIAMADLDAVRAALGYETINLYGASYGTRAALTYLRLYPQRVRTILLDAVVDPGFVMFMDAGADGQDALELFFARCAKDEACSTTFPTLQADFDALLQRLDTAPENITLPHPLTGKAMDLEVTRQLVTSMVFNSLYSPHIVATLPLSIQAAAQGNYVPLVSQALLLNAGLYDGMFYAVTCTEDAPLISAPEAEKRSQGSVFGNRTLDFAEVCAAWPKGQVSPDFRAPVVSDVPILIFSGEADPITPPWHAQEVAESLTNELHLVFKGMGHGNLNSRCTARLLKDFIDSASITGLDTACVETIAPPPFFVDFSGPRP